MKKILVADDQIPEPGLSDPQEIRNRYTKRWKDPAFAEGFVFFQNLLAQLKDNGYDIVPANTPKEVIRQIEAQSFDCVVLDLGWYTEEAIPYDERMRLGFPLAKQIREHSSCPIIMFSNRFPEKNSLASVAAESDLLPVYKVYNQTCVDNLLVAIRYATARRQSSARQIDEAKKSFNMWMYRTLSRILVGTILLSVVTVFVALVLLILSSFVKNVQIGIGIINGLVGVTSGVTSGIVFKYVREYEKTTLSGVESPPSNTQSPQGAAGT